MRELPLQLFRDHGITPGRLLELTPYEFAYLFFRKERPTPVNFTPDAETIIEFNRKHRTPKGQPPYIPTWHLKHLRPTHA